MDYTRSRSAVPGSAPTHRERLASPWVLGALAACMLVLLVLSFPRKTLVEQLSRQHGADPLTLSYVSNLLKTNPDNDELRLVLAQQKIFLGKGGEARVELGHVLQRGGPEARSQARLLQFSLDESEAYALPAGSAERDAAIGRLRTRLQDLAEYDWGAEAIMFLARTAVSLDDSRLAVEYNQRAARKVGKGLSHSWFASAGQAALATGDYGLAAQLWFAAQADAPTPELRRDYFFKAVRGLQSGNLVKEAVAAARDHLGELARDEDVLTDLAALALSAGDYQAASDWYFAARRLAEDPETRAFYYGEGLKALIAGNRPADALEAGRREIGDYADDEQTLLTLARVALAAGRHKDASDLLFHAREVSTDRAARRAHYKAAVGALQAANKPREALAAARANLGDLAGDEDILVFLIQLARAANEPRTAEELVRQLLHMSSAGPGLAERLLSLLVAEARAADGVAPTATPAPRMRPFDDAIYSLAYEVFVGNAKLPDALAVAREAVRQQPGNLKWRERLAQTLEWSGQPAEGLREWRELARRGKAEAAWLAVLRLAPGLFDDEAVLEAWQHLARSRKADDATLSALVAAYERLGRPEEGIAFLAGLDRDQQEPLILEKRAFLLERAGRLSEAAAEYQRLLERAGPSPQRARNLALLLVQQGDYGRAYEVLTREGARVEAADRAYLELLGELAWRLDQEETSRQVYGQLAGRDDATSLEFERLVLLTAARDPAAAARIAEQGARRFKRPDLLLTALENWAARQDMKELGRLFGSLSADSTAALEGYFRYHVLRAQWLQASGRYKEAYGAYRRAVALAPDEPDLKSALLWLAIDRRDEAELRRLLADLAPAAETDDDLAAGFAAGWMTLGEPRRALPWFRRQMQAKGEDYLWLLSYADALEQSGEAGQALRVRRHAWTGLRGGAQPPGASEREVLAARARLALEFTPGDEAANLMRALLRQDQDPARDPVTRELLLSWAFSTESVDSAKAWLWRGWGRQLTEPRWARVAVALAEGDAEALERLLEEPEKLSPYDRVDAAREARKVELAQSLLYEAQEARRDDDIIHLKLTETMLESASRVYVKETRFHRGVLEGHETVTAVHLWITPRLKISAELGAVRQRSRDAIVLNGVPGLDRRVGISALFVHNHGDTRVSLGWRDAFSDFASASLEHRDEWLRGLTTDWGLGLNLRADDTTALAVAGMKDQIDAGVQWAFSKREYLNARLRLARYHDQEGGGLGSGRALDWELGHRLRTEYPDLSFRLAGTVQRFSPGGSPEPALTALTPDGTLPAATLFLPQDFNLWGLSVGFGDALKEGYTRGLRPWAVVGLTRNSVSGQGYNAALGLAGSVWGDDVLSLSYGNSKGGGGTGDRTWEFSLIWQLLFDGM